jgi:CheY-like chemotaxis protein
VLVVDDNPDSAESLAALLSIVGHEVHQAHDGRQALELARRRVPDLVLLDIGMPGMSGHEVARRLRGDVGLRETVLIALTGYGTDEDRRASHEAGFDGHLVKPIDFEALERILAALPTRRSEAA